MTELDTTADPARSGPTLAPRSIRHKLVALAIALVVGPGLLFGAIADQNARASLERTIGAQLAREAEHTAERLDARVAAERAALASFARQDLMREVRIGDIDKRVSSALRTLEEGAPARLAYAVVDAAGSVVASSAPRLLGPPEPWLAAAAGSARGSDGVRELRGFDGPVLLLATAVPDPDGDAHGPALGTLVAVLSWPRLLEVAEDARAVLAGMGHAVRVVVLGGGEVLGGAGLDEHTSSWLPAALAVGAAGSSAMGHRADARHGWLVGSAMLGGHLPGDRVVVVEALDEALAPVRTLRRRLGIGLLITLSAAVGIATVAAGRIVDPLQRLTDAIRRVTLSKAAAERVEVSGHDEVAELGAAFNRMAADLEQAHRDLVEAAKFAFVGELAAGVAHEVRTALGVLRSSSQLLARSLPDEADDDLRELASMILDEVARLNRVVDDLLSLARPRTLNAEPTRLGEALERAASFVESQARASGVTIDSSGVGDEEAQCDPELVYRAALNLLVNALGVLERGGRVALRTTRAGGGMVAFEVVDDGPGVPPELIDRVFSPFVTAREGGIGLGLTFVQRVALDHGGRVLLESSPGRGARFRVELPAARRDA